MNEAAFFMMGVAGLGVVGRATVVVDIIAARGTKAVTAVISGLPPVAARPPASFMARTSPEPRKA